jgi:succinate dehydrogenase / fumarate reductase cytochrome b subunit
MAHPSYQKEALMSLKRNVGLAGLRYRGGGPMLAWILHRVSGLAMIIFVSIHVVASFFMQQVGSDLATAINIVYESIYFQVFIYFVVIFHTLNGLRIILLDTWPKLLEYQREMTWLQWLVFIPIYGLTIFIMISKFIQGG